MKGKGYKMFKNRQNTLDLLQKKEERLSELMMQSDSAIQMVRSTITNLGAVNQNIEETMGEIDTYLQRLSDTKVGLDATHSKNKQIMQNFSQLLCVE